MVFYADMFNRYGVFTVQATQRLCGLKCKEESDVSYEAHDYDIISDKTLRALTKGENPKT